MSQVFLDLKQTAQTMHEHLIELGQIATTFSARSGIACKPGCGACCAKPFGVWATPAEMLPMAFQLFEEGYSSASIRDLAETRATGVCLAYETSDPLRQQGRCGRYSVRPTVCILFGSGVRPNKNGAPEFMGCSWQHQRFRSEIEAIEASTLADEHNAGSLTAKIRSISPDPKLSIEAPVNEALTTALELIEFHHQFFVAETLDK